MRLVVITHVLHTNHNTHYYAYAPYVREMNIWFKHLFKLDCRLEFIYVSKMIDLTCAKFLPIWWHSVNQDKHVTCQVIALFNSCELFKMHTNLVMFQCDAKLQTPFSRANSKQSAYACSCGSRLNGTSFETLYSSLRLI